MDNASDAQIILWSLVYMTENSKEMKLKKLTFHNI